MNKKPDLPEGWAMPPAIAKRVSDGVNKKSESPEDKVQSALDKMARDIALIEPDPQNWGWWVSYLLEQLEGEAEKNRLTDQNDYSLIVLAEKIQKRIEGGKW